MNRTLFFSVFAIAGLLLVNKDINSAAGPAAAEGACRELSVASASSATGAAPRGTRGGTLPCVRAGQRGPGDGSGGGKRDNPGENGDCPYSRAWMPWNRDRPRFSQVRARRTGSVPNYGRVGVRDGLFP